MIWSVYLFLIILVFFLYIFIPFVRSVIVRIYWRKIRSMIVKTKKAQLIEYGYNYNDDKLKVIYGRLDGFSNKDQVWIESRDCIIMAQMKNQFCFY